MFQRLQSKQWFAISDQKNFEQVEKGQNVANERQVDRIKEIDAELEELNARLEKTRKFAQMQHDKLKSNDCYDVWWKYLQ